MYIYIYNFATFIPGNVRFPGDILETFSGDKDVFKTFLGLFGDLYCLRVYIKLNTSIDAEDSDVSFGNPEVRDDLSSLKIPAFIWSIKLNQLATKNFICNIDYFPWYRKENTSIFLCIKINLLRKTTRSISIDRYDSFKNCKRIKIGYSTCPLWSDASDDLSTYCLLPEDQNNHRGKHSLWTSSCY